MILLLIVLLDIDFPSARARPRRSRGIIRDPDAGEAHHHVHDGPYTYNATRIYTTALGHIRCLNTQAECV